jgi:hypothetical protein
MKVMDDNIYELTELQLTYLISTIIQFRYKMGFNIEFTREQVDENFEEIKGMLKSPLMDFIYMLDKNSTTEEVYKILDIKK